MKKFIAALICASMVFMFTISAVSALVSNSWSSSLSDVGAPAPRSSHTVVWDNVGLNNMYVWGGRLATRRTNTGAFYSTFDNAWFPITTDGAPSSRVAHTAVWANDCKPEVGNQPCMIVWGGQDDAPTVNTGGRYDPDTASWTPTSMVGAPAGRIKHTAVWTGTEMLVWGGITAFGGATVTGARYNPVTDTWTAMSATDAPQARYNHTAVWADDCEAAAGNQPCMIVWGGINKTALPSDPIVSLNTGAKYNPITNTWTSIDAEFAPEARGSHTAVWLDGLGTMIVWGGVDCSVVGSSDCEDKPISTGGVYDAATNTWRSTSDIGAPSPRYAHTAVWNDSEMLVWGGHNGDIAGGSLNTGAAYDPATDIWTTMSTVNAPSPRLLHTAVWTGTEMLVWGGALHTGGGALTRLGDGKRFTP